MTVESQDIAEAGRDKRLRAHSDHELKMIDIIRAGPDRSGAA